MLVRSKVDKELVYYTNGTALTLKPYTVTYIEDGLATAKALTDAFGSRIKVFEDTVSVNKGLEEDVTEKSLAEILDKVQEEIKIADTEMTDLTDEEAERLIQEALEDVEDKQVQPIEEVEESLQEVKEEKKSAKRISRKGRRGSKSKAE